MRQTAWTNKSSVPSDRIPPSRPASGQGKKAAKGKQQEQPKSEEVRRLERLRDALRDASSKDRDPKGGCFCQARVHRLSPHTPICYGCGLVLCDVNLPQFACPHCKSPLLTPSARDSLVATLDSQIAETLAREEESRERALQQAREAAGAFPTLSGASGPQQPDMLSSHPMNQTHKILSLNSKTKKVTISSYTPPAMSRSSSKEKVKEKQEEEQTRVPAPPPEVFYAKAGSDPLRPWANLRGPTVTYVPPPKSSASGPSSSGSRRRKSKAKENQGQAS